MEKRYIFAFVLIALVIVAQMVFLRQIEPERSPETPPTEITGQRKTSTDNQPTGQVNSNDLEVARDIQRQWEITVRTNKYEITLDQSAVALEWKLVEYLERGQADESTDSVLVNLIPEGAKNCLQIVLAPNTTDAILRASKALDLAHWQLTDSSKFNRTEEDKESYSLDLRENTSPRQVVFSTEIPQQVKIWKKFTFYPDTYYADLEIAFQNISPTGQAVRIGDGQYDYSLRWGPGIFGDRIPHDQAPSEKNEGAIALKPSEPSKVEFMKRKELGNPDNRTDGVKVITGKNEKPEPVLWTGLNNRYFAAVLIPETSRGAHAKLIELGELNLPATEKKSQTRPEVVASTQAASLLIPESDLTGENFDRFRIFVGPKITSLLSKVEAPDSTEEKPEKVYLDAMLSFGWMAPVARFLLGILNLCHKIVNNYGVAIILLTLIVKLATAPLTLKAYRASLDMKKIQPQLTSLKEKYRDNPQRFNQEQMALFKKNKVNPFGGCLPMLPSMPIFFALFDLLRNAIELRGASFWWISDLTAPDAIYVLPFTIPFLGENLNLLPLLYAGTTLLQQKIGVGMETANADNPNMKMMQYMPLIFTFIFYNFASGLVLYFLCSNIFTIFQNLITKRILGGEESVGVIQG